MQIGEVAPPVIRWRDHSVFHRTRRLKGVAAALVGPSLETQRQQTYELALEQFLNPYRPVDEVVHKLRTAAQQQVPLARVNLTQVLAPSTRSANAHEVPREYIDLYRARQSEQAMPSRSRMSADERNQRAIQASDPMAAIRTHRMATAEAARPSSHGFGSTW